MNKGKVAIINSVYNIGSTGRICYQLTNYLNDNGYEALTYYGRSKNNSKGGVFFGNLPINSIDLLFTRLFDRCGVGSSLPTRILIHKLKKLKPDLFVLNNLHGYYVNYKLLLSYIYKTNKPVIWVFHDCWNFTGHCGHFLFNKCDKWKSGCEKCNYLSTYPKSILFSRSKKNLLDKKAAIGKLNDLTIVTPSVWLSNMVKQSYLNKYDVLTINNGIDVSKFKHIDNIDSSFIDKYKGKKIILSVAFVFDERKGLRDLVKLSKVINDDYVIIMIGLIKDKTVKLPHNVIHIEKTNDINELNTYYSLADVLFNPTYEDNYPTVNMEAMVCNLPVICYDAGGACEMIDQNFVIKPGDIEKAYDLIKKLVNKEIKYDFSKNESFNNKIMLEKYLSLIKEKLKR